MPHLICRDRAALAALALAAALASGLAAPPARAYDSCEYAGDGECDESDVCEPGTDETDCAAASGDEDEVGDEDDGGAAVCEYAGDGECDEPGIGTGACAAGTDAEDCAAAGPAEDAAAALSDEERQEVDDFIVNNTVGTIYHELGHALVDLFGLPVLGREEDAVDNLATLMMLSEQPDDRLDQMVADSADVYDLADLEAQKQDWAPDYADAHSLDLQRYYELVCVVYGSDPERFADLADEAELSEDRRDDCPFDYEQTATAWATLLEPHRPGSGEGDGQVVLRFAEADERAAPLAELVRASPTVQAIPGQLREEFALPVDLEVAFDHCDEENAWYDPGTQSITMCYELLESFERLIAGEIAER